LQTNLIDLFKQTDDILLNQMDALMPAFRDAHPDFVQTYTAARTIIDPPSKAKPPEGATGKNAEDEPKPT
jgi:hypothetical protein